MSAKKVNKAFIPWDMSGFVYRNPDKKKPTDVDWQGRITVHNEVLYIALWERKSPKGKPTMKIALGDLTMGESD